MWDHLGNISTAIVHIQGINKKIAMALGTLYQSTGHTTLDTLHLVWWVQWKVANEGLQEFQSKRPNNSQRKLTVNILKIDEAKLKLSTLTTFSKKTIAMIVGHGFEDNEEEECPAMC
jgi:hypothetical protein